MKTADPVDILPALAKFSTSIFQIVSEKAGPSENVCVSPFSVAAVLSMAHEGARGRTAEQMKNVLHFSGFENNQISEAMGKLCLNIKGNQKYTLKTANQMYVANKYQLTEQFQTSVKNHFGAAAENVDFESDETRTNINKWVADYTQQKIRDLLPFGSLNMNTRLVLVNAVYFSCNWQKNFDASNTKVESFYLGHTDSKVNVNMMHNNNKFNSGYFDALDARILELPFSGFKLSMFILLPNKIDGLPTLESKLSDNDLEDILSATSSAQLDVAIPKFKIEANVEMKEVLIEMGMADLFDSKQADLSGISGQKDLFVSDVVHKTFIDVNEEGCEAAAATAMLLLGNCFNPNPPPPPFVADHPFIYLIRDNRTRTVLFIGKFTSPSN